MGPVQSARWVHEQVAGERDVFQQSSQSSDFRIFLILGKEEECPSMWHHEKPETVISAALPLHRLLPRLLPSPWHGALCASSPSSTNRPVLLNVTHCFQTAPLFPSVPSFSTNNNNTNTTAFETASQRGLLLEVSLSDFGTVLPCGFALPEKGLQGRPRAESRVCALIFKSSSEVLFVHSFFSINLCRVMNFTIY